VCPFINLEAGLGAHILIMLVRMLIALPLRLKVYISLFIEKFRAKNLIF
jgi:hypothetical protein